jgi:hypothetical protein
MLHKLVRLFRRWNDRFRDNPTRFHDARFGTVEDVAEAQAQYLIYLAEEDDLRIDFFEHGDARRRALEAPEPPPVRSDS